jgi:hypothetical protein
MTTNILVLAAGRSKSEDGDGEYPQCLTELDGVSLLERIVTNLQSFEDARFTFAVLEKDARKFHLDKVASLLMPGVEIVQIPEDTRGSACTALLASIRMDSGNDLLIISANELVDVELPAVIAQFKQRSLDGGTLIFRSLHPRYSYVRLDENQLVVEAAALQPISQNATTGIFWFRRTADFVDAAKSLIRKEASVNGNYYVAPTFNELILRQGKIGVHELPPNKYLPLKTERQVRRYEGGGNP